jgi:methylmalonyl-CoA mutase
MSDKEKIEQADNLFEEFDPVAREEWEKVITRDLDGDDYKKTLRWDTGEGFSVLPFYMKEDLEKLALPDNLPGEYPYLRGNRKTADWEITENITASDIEESNRLAREAVNMGAGSLYLYTEVAPHEGMLGGDIRGVPLQQQADMEKLLDGIDLTEISVCFDAGVASPLYHSMFLNELERQNLGISDAAASFCYDPFTWGARHGRWSNKEDRIGEIISDLIQSPYRTLSADGTFYHQCGATMTQELGIALAIGSEFLAYAAARGLDISRAAGSVHMKLPVGSYYFPEIAKFRAVRLLWSKVVSVYDEKAGHEAKLKIRAETSPWNKAVSDPYNNILRSTTEAMSAIAGGVDSIRIEPFDSRFRQPSPFSQRIARNIHHILRHESYLHKVTDPAAGSYYIEQLTDEIASKSWDFFKFLEQQGGFSKALEGRFLQLALQESIQEKQTAIRQRKRVLVGSNHYPNPEEQMPEAPYRDLPAESLQQTERHLSQDAGLEQIRQAFADGARAGDTVHTVLQVQKQLYPSMLPWHASELFETIRMETAGIRKKTGHIPVVALLPVGSKKMRTARASFARNYLGVAGYDIREHSVFDSIGEAADQFKSINPDMIVLCSSDEEYRELAGPFCKTFRESFSPEPLLILAGNPGESAGDYRKLGINAFIHGQSDMVDTLSDIHSQLEEKLS